MTARLPVLVSSMTAGGLAGAAFAAWPGALVGVFSAALAVGLHDAWQRRRLLAWLRQLQIGGPKFSDADLSALQPPQGGWLDEVVDRTLRLVKAQSRARQESQQRLLDMLAAIQASPNGVVLLDPDGRIEWCNQTAAQHLGLDVTRDLRQYVANLIRDPGFSAYAAAGDFNGDLLVAGRASTPSRPVRLSLQLHPYGQGRRLLLSRDVTLIEQAEAMRRDFVANVSHEMRTPLTVLAGFVETLQTLDLSPQEVRRYLDLMATQSQRMQTLVSDLLTLSRLEGSPLPGLSESFPVQALMTQCELDASALSSYMGRAQHRLEFDLQGVHSFPTRRSSDDRKSVV